MDKEINQNLIIENNKKTMSFQNEFERKYADMRPENLKQKQIEDDKLTVEEQYERLKRRARKVFNNEDIEKLDKAFELAHNAHKSQVRLSGKPYITHPIAVADILLDYNMDAPSIITAILHDCVEDTDVKLSYIAKQFGNDVAELVDGVTKLGKVPLATREEQQAENIRKMLLAMNKDIRVIIIKLADRVHNMRTLNYMSPQKRRDKATETLGIYAPIAHRLGIRPAKEELEDLSIRYLDPVAYKDIEEKIKGFGTADTGFLKVMISDIKKRVDANIKNAEISGRIKSVNGIYRKMYLRNRQFDEIYDIFAVRILVESVYDCYAALGLIHDMFKPLPGRFKDYISTPKTNMYQSLHTTVIGKEGVPFEVQIRTFEMHKTAEYGIAAHWKYKDGVKQEGNTEKRLSWIREMLDEQKDTGDVSDIVNAIKSDLAPDDIFVFTPKGDVIMLPAGSTVIDFAYAIHTEVGHTMVGAKIDGRINQLSAIVKTGEIVEIITQKGTGPSRDWLNIAKTSGARSKIRTWFKNEKRDENIITGKAMVESELLNNYIRLSSEDYIKFLKNLAERQRMKSIDEFYAAVGYGGLSIRKMLPYIKEEYNRNYVKHDVVLTNEDKIVSRNRNQKAGVIVEGIDDLAVKFSKCCNPVPGDSVIGFITRGHGVSIHKKDCPNVPIDVLNSSEPERWVNVKWNDQAASAEFKAELEIGCLSRIGMMADISSCLAMMKVNIHEISSRDTADGRNFIRLKIDVSNSDHLKNVMSRLNKIDGIISVSRP
ncbi:MAG: RelA/SpoT family protein [Candidatus Fimenecus sp.]